MASLWNPLARREQAGANRYASVSLAVTLIGHAGRVQLEGISYALVLGPIGVSPPALELP